MQRNQISEDVELAKQLLEGTGYEMRRIRETTEDDYTMEVYDAKCFDMDDSNVILVSTDFDIIVVAGRISEDKPEIYDEWEMFEIDFPDYMLSKSKIGITNRY